MTNASSFYRNAAAASQKEAEWGICPESLNYMIPNKVSVFVVNLSTHWSGLCRASASVELVEEPGPRPSGWWADSEEAEDISVDELFDSFCPGSVDVEVRTFSLSLVMVAMKSLGLERVSPFTWFSWGSHGDAGFNWKSRPKSQETGCNPQLRW